MSSSILFLNKKHEKKVAQRIRYNDNCHAGICSRTEANTCLIIKPIKLNTANLHWNPVSRLSKAFIKTRNLLSIFYLLQNAHSYFDPVNITHFEPHIVQGPDTLRFILSLIQFLLPSFLYNVLWNKTFCRGLIFAKSNFVTFLRNLKFAHLSIKS